MNCAAARFCGTVPFRKSDQTWRSLRHQLPCSRTSTPAALSDYPPALPRNSRAVNPCRCIGGCSAQMDLRPPRVSTRITRGHTSVPAGARHRPGTQQWVLREINSPLDPSQYGESARQRCMAPGCIGTWLRCGSGGTSPSPHLVVRGHTTAGDLPGDTAAGVAGNQQSVRFVAIRQIRAAKVHGTWLRLAPGCVAMERCMAPGCIEGSRLRWNFALPTPGCPGTHHSRRPTRGHSSGVLREINSPLDPSQFGESARQRCMAPGCIEVSRLRWNFALPKTNRPPQTNRPPRAAAPRTKTFGFSIPMGV